MKANLCNRKQWSTWVEPRHVRQIIEFFSDPSHFYHVKFLCFEHKGNILKLKREKISCKGKKSIQFSPRHHSESNVTETRQDYLEERPQNSREPPEHPDQTAHQTQRASLKHSKSKKSSYTWGRNRGQRSPKNCQRTPYSKTKNVKIWMTSCVGSQSLEMARVTELRRKWQRCCTYS